MPEQAQKQEYPLDEARRSTAAPIPLSGNQVTVCPRCNHDLSVFDSHDQEGTVRVHRMSVCLDFLKSDLKYAAPDFDAQKEQKQVRQAKGIQRPGEPDPKARELESQSQGERVAGQDPRIAPNPPGRWEYRTDAGAPSDQARQQAKPSPEDEQKREEREKEDRDSQARIAETMRQPEGQPKPPWPQGRQTEAEMKAGRLGGEAEVQEEATKAQKRQEEEEKGRGKGKKASEESEEEGEEEFDEEGKSKGKRKKK